MNIIDKIKFEEGDKAKMYKCPAGKWTIGAGINLEQQEMPREVRDLWLRIILRRNFELIFDRLSLDYCVSFRKFPGNAKLVIEDMAYQMGVNGLFGFKSMIACIVSGEYMEAADHLLDSNYASEEQTPERANRNADLLRGCA